MQDSFSDDIKTLQQLDEAENSPPMKGQRKKKPHDFDISAFSNHLKLKSQFAKKKERSKTVIKSIIPQPQVRVDSPSNFKINDVENFGKGTKNNPYGFNRMQTGGVGYKYSQQELENLKQGIEQESGFLVENPGKEDDYSMDMSDAIGSVSDQFNKEDLSKADDSSIGDIISQQMKNYEEEQGRQDDDQLSEDQNEENEGDDDDVVSGERSKNESSKNSSDDDDSENQDDIHPLSKCANFKTAEFNYCSGYRKSKVLDWS